MTFDEIRNLDLRDIDFRNIAEWPLAGRAFLFAVLLVIIFAIGYFLAIRGEISDLKAAHGQETQLRQTIEQKQRLVANLAAYQRQLAEMQKSFAQLLQKLPSQNEIDNLLRDISQTAQEDGLGQKLFQPQAEKVRDFYAEKPIAMDYVGSYQQIAKFVSDVAALPRIVTFADFTLAPVKAGDGSQLDFSVTAVTYRYLTEEEMAKAQAAKTKKPRRKP